MDADHKRRISAGASWGMKRYMEFSKCPACGRKGAIKRLYIYGQPYKQCRYCGYEKVINLA